MQTILFCLHKITTHSFGKYRRIQISFYLCVLNGLRCWVEYLDMFLIVTLSWLYDNYKETKHFFSTVISDVFLNSFLWKIRRPFIQTAVAAAYFSFFSYFINFFYFIFFFIMFVVILNVFNHLIWSGWLHFFCKRFIFNSFFWFFIKYISVNLGETIIIFM